mgnify:CR=1 FL=1
MKNLKTKLTIIGLSFLSITAFAQDYIYKGVKNVEATIGMNNSEGDSGQETVSADCYDPANIGQRISAQGCDGLLIVDNNSLRQMVRNNENYSDTNIFTGQVTDMSYLFCNFYLSSPPYDKCTLKEPIYSILNWNTENVKTMEMMFRDSNTNINISEWDLTSLESIKYMFHSASNFNQSLNNWDVSNVKNMAGAFYNASSFNGLLNNWDTSNVNSMYNMFNGASSFNQPLNNWKVNNVNRFHDMFNGASSFNQPLNNWDLINATMLSNMFQGAINFNQNISEWCVPTISTKPSRFDENSGFENQTQLQPNWGSCP